MPETEIPSQDRELGAHLLRRFGLGASEAELDYFLQDGYAGAVEKLVNPAATEEVDIADVEDLRNAKGALKPGAVAAWWTMRLLTTRRPLLEKMTLFWHNHFATGADKVNSGDLMYAQNHTLRTHALGKFGDLLLAVAQDPAMLFYLDNQQNVKGKPNENFAREVMELFTLGVGHYTEQDVQEGARCFTGWSFQKGGKNGDPKFVLRDNLHDKGSKTFLGKSVSTGEEVLAILCQERQTATFLVTKLWNWFVYPAPSPQVIAPLAKQFYDSGLDITVLLRSIMMSSEFQSDQARHHLVKNPVDFCVVTLRQLGIGEAVAANKIGPAKPTKARAGVAAVTANAMRSQGMWLMYPPDVSGWKPGNAWITTATMIERTAWPSRVFGTADAKRIPYAFSVYALFQQDSKPEVIVDRFLSIFDVAIPPDKREILISGAKQGLGDAKLTASNANKVGSAVCRLLFSLPEFQLA